MKNMVIDGVEITPQILKVMGEWTTKESGETRAETFISYLEQIKNTFIRLMCDPNNQEQRTKIIEALEGLLVIEDEFKTLIPKS